MRGNICKFGPILQRGATRATIFGSMLFLLINSCNAPQRIFLWIYIPSSLVRDCRYRSSQNPGIAKRGGTQNFLKWDPILTIKRGPKGDLNNMRRGLKMLWFIELLDYIKLLDFIELSDYIKSSNYILSDYIELSNYIKLSHYIRLFIRALYERSILTPADLRYLFWFPRYPNLKMHA